MSEINNNEDLNEVFTVEFDEATVVTVPIDDTLSNSGEAADAAAVGAALALKADAASITTIKVNGESADNQGNILISGSDIPVSGASGAEMLDVAVTALQGRTGADIPVNAETGAQTIADALSEVGTQTATDIRMESESTVTVAQKISAMDATAANHQTAITALQGKTAETILVKADDTETVKEALDARAKSVNGVLPDTTGDVELNSVPFAENLDSVLSQASTGTYIMRTAGGSASIEDGGAWLMDIKGSSVHTGYTAESLTMTVVETGTEGHLSAELNRDTFVAYVAESGTITMVYGTAWTVSGTEVNPANYGLTLSGVPVSGDQIIIVYVKEIPGNIAVSTPSSFKATGWNLYDHSNGYARVVKYSATQGYKISGTYTAIKFSATYDGTKSDVTVTSGYFNPFSDQAAIGSTGYIWITGGNSTDTAIWMTMSDWTDAHAGDFAAYSETEVDLSGVMAENFPNGLLKAGTVVDELNLNIGTAYVRVERMANNAENMATAKASGREYEYDEDYIYIAKATPSTVSVSGLDGGYTANDHGLEWFEGTDAPVYAETLYGNNLKNKLERDVLTISQQTLTSAQKNQVRSNIGAGTDEFQNGDSFALGIAIAVLQATSSTSVTGYVLMPKKIVSGTSITVTGNNNVIRDVNGTQKLAGNSANIVCERQADYTMKVTMTVNNGTTPFTQYAYYFSGLNFTITFER